MKTYDNMFIQALSHLELLIPTDMLLVKENLWDRGLLRPVTQPVDNFRVVVDIDLKTQRETSIHLVLSSTGAVQLQPTSRKGTDLSLRRAFAAKQ